MTYSLDIINLAIQYLINKENKINIASCLNLTRQTVYEWSKKFNYNIINNIPVTQEQIKNNKNHKNNKINKYIDNINLFINNNIGCSLNDIYTHINKEISKSSICNILKKLNISHKKINNNIVCKDIDKIINERKIFATNFNMNINDIIYIDESSFCINQTKNYGYSKKGEKINKLTRHKHNKLRYTLLAAISNKNIVNYEIINESVNKNIYLDFIKKNKEIFKNKVIIQDNARIHHSIIVKNYASKENIIMKYNPPYTPEFNPIEFMFNKCKIEFKKLNHTNLIEDIIESINKITENDCKQFFNHTEKNINKYKFINNH
jgi:hypothetical protein